MGLLEDAIREHLDLKRRRGADADEVEQAERDALGPPGRPTPLEETASAALDPDEAPYEAGEAEFDDAYEPDEVPADERLDPGGPTRLYDYGANDEDELVETEIVDEELPDVPAFLDEEAPAAPAAAGAPAAPEEAETHIAPAPQAPPPLEGEPDEDEEPLDEGEEPLAGSEEPAGAGARPAAEDDPADAGNAGDAGDPDDAADQADAGEPGDVGERSDAAGEEGEDVLEETPDFLQETPEHDRLWFEQKPPRDFDFGN